MSGVERRPLLIGSAALAGLTALVAWALGVTLRQSAVLAVAVVAGGALRGVAGLYGHARRDSRWRDGTTRSSDGVRRDVRQLTWRLGGSPTELPRLRLRALAATRLAAHGFDLDAPADAPAIARLLGADVAVLLGAEAPRRPVRVAALARAIVAVDRLGPSPTAADDTTPTNATGAGP